MLITPLHNTDRILKNRVDGKVFALLVVSFRLSVISCCDTKKIEKGDIESGEWLWKVEAGN